MDDIKNERVDLMEVNHFYDEQGRLVFDQVIFYDWRPYAVLREGQRESGWRYQVRAWRLVKNPNILPQRDWEQGDWYSLFEDGIYLRRIRAPSVRETWTQYDPELAEREYLAKERRPELMKDLEPSNVALP